MEQGETREVLTGGGVEAGSVRASPRRRRRCSGGDGGVREVADPPERGEGNGAASPYLVLHRGAWEPNAACLSF